VASPTPRGHDVGLGPNTLSLATAAFAQVQARSSKARFSSSRTAWDDSRKASSAYSRKTVASDMTTFLSKRRFVGVFSGLERWASRRR
jgi:hypothetical protein